MVIAATIWEGLSSHILPDFLSLQVLFESVRHAVVHLLQVRPPGDLSARVVLYAGKISQLRSYRGRLEYTMKISPPDMVSTTSLEFSTLPVLDHSQGVAPLRRNRNAHMDFVSVPTINSPTRHDLRNRFVLRERGLNRKQI